MPFDPESQRKNSVKNATYIAKMAKKMPDIAEAIKQAKLSGIKLNSNVSYVIFALLFLSAVGSVTYSVLNKDLRESAYDPEQPLPEIDEVAFRDLVSKSISPNTTSQNRREVMMAVDTMPIMEKRRVAVSLSVMSHRMPSIAEKNNNYPLYVSDSSGKKANEEVSLARISSRGFPVRVSDGFRYETESSMYLNMDAKTDLGSRLGDEPDSLSRVIAHESDHVMQEKFYQENGLFATSLENTLKTCVGLVDEMRDALTNSLLHGSDEYFIEVGKQICKKRETEKFPDSFFYSESRYCNIGDIPDEEFLKIGKKTVEAASLIVGAYKYDTQKCYEGMSSTVEMAFNPDMLKALFGEDISDKINKLRCEHEMHILNNYPEVRRDVEEAFPRLKLVDGYTCKEFKRREDALRNPEAVARPKHVRL